MDQSAAGSQFVPKLTGGVNKSFITLGAKYVQIAHPNNPKLNIQLPTLDKRIDWSLLVKSGMILVSNKLFVYIWDNLLTILLFLGKQGVCFFP
jgi:hypothetical protein